MCPQNRKLVTANLVKPDVPKLQYRLKLWDHLPRFCLGRTAVLVCSFTSAKPCLTALKTSVSPRLFPIDSSHGERQDAVGFEWAIVGFVLSGNRQTVEFRCGNIHTEIFERTLHWRLYRAEGK